MALSILSPGVQITETDLSQTIAIPGGTFIYVPGFAPQGPTDEVLQITSISEFEQIYGTPTTAAERYFYYNSRAVLNSNGNLLTTRLPYGSAAGEGFTNLYSALFYPVASGSNDTVTQYTVGAPVHLTFGEDTYLSLLQNNFNWSGLTHELGKVYSEGDDAYVDGAYDPMYEIGGQLDAGIVILNSAQTAIDEANQGYYISIADNTNWGPSHPFNSVTNIWSLSSADYFTSVSNTNLGFTLSAAAGTIGSSVSQAVEATNSYNFGQDYYNDSVVLNVFKVRNSTYQPGTLIYSIAETFTGSLNSQKKSIAIIGGTPATNYLEDIVNNGSKNVKILINPAISRLTNWQSVSSANPAVSVRVDDGAKALYAEGVWAPTYNYTTSNTVGSVDQKVSRALDLVSSPENTTIDIVVDAGLSTIFANTSANEVYNDKKFTDTSSLSSYGESDTLQKWKVIFDLFNNYVQNTRKDCVFISDPLRQIFVNGSDVKTLANRGATFTKNIFIPLAQSVVTIDTNYSTIYGNWVKVFDTYSNTFSWVPASGFVAGVYANSSAATQPWVAPAGLNRGIINNITDIAFNPNQKQRDYLYTVGVNPIVLFSNEGYVVYGQKTLQNKPSAFDRVNVRRLFLTLERAVQNAVKYFVFEPNTDFTRTRLVNTITPIFELAKNTQGLYDYLIVCDERNNTSASIDNNQLNVDIYIKPVRAAEFILVNFIATRTSQSFNELI